MLSLAVAVLAVCLCSVAAAPLPTNSTATEGNNGTAPTTLVPPTTKSPQVQGMAEISTCVPGQANCDPMPSTDAPNCNLPQDRGTCRNSIRRFSYSPETGRCVMFYYSGCGGNSNNFATTKDCRNACEISSQH